MLAAQPRIASLYIPGKPQCAAAQTTSRGPIVLPKPPPAIKRLKPKPFLFGEALATRPGETAWNIVELTPAKNKTSTREYTFDVKPSRLIKVAVRAGERITKYLAPALSAKYPINGLRIEGILAIVVIKPTEVSESERFSIRVGRIGGKKEVNKSWKRCPPATT